MQDADTANHSTIHLPNHVMTPPFVGNVLSTDTRQAYNECAHSREFGDLILDYINCLGIEFIFGVPGGAIEPLYNALARSERAGGAKAVVACHETAAAFMADGYARESGRLGVCCATTGPGTTNLITGVASAYADNIPLLVITAQTSILSFGRYGLQESSCTGVDTVSMLQFCTRYNTLVSHPDQLERKLQTAINYAFGPIPGPVHISIPLDIMRASCGAAKKIDFAIAEFYRNQQLSDHDFRKLLRLTENTPAITVVIGEGCEGAAEVILQVAQLKGWSVVSTPMAKGLVPSYHPCYFGVFGMSGHEYAHKIVSPEYADIVILVGSNLDEISTAGWDQQGICSQRLIHIDNNPKHLAQSSVAQLQIYAAPFAAFKALYDEYRSKASHAYVESSSGFNREFPIYLSAEERQKCAGGNPVNRILPIKPQYLARELSRRCPVDTRIAADSGASFMWVIHYWEINSAADLNKNLFRAGMGYSSMGWAIGAAIGLAKANPAQPVVCMTGDGSVLMSGQDIATALVENANILFVILNDSAYGLVKHGQRLAGAESIAWQLPLVNFAKIAEAMEIESYHIKSQADFDELDIESILRKPGPCVLDVMIDAEELPPMGMRMKVLGTVNT